MNINGRMKVKTLKAQFKSEFGLTLRVYDGRSFADDESTLASIRKGDAKGGEFSPRKNTKVGNLEDKIVELFGIKNQVAGSDDSYLCDNDLTLAKALVIDEVKLDKRKKKANTVDNTETDVADDNDLENVNFIAEQSGEFGIGELLGARLDEFKLAFEQKSLMTSVFVDTPFEVVDSYFTGLLMTEDSLDEWDIPTAELKTEGEIGFPCIDEEYKKGIYLIYTVLSDRYEVNLNLKDKDSLIFKGPEINIGGLEPDFEAGELSEYTLAHSVVIDNKEENVLDYMEDLDGLRQSIIIVQVTEDGEDNVLYSNCNGDEEYYDYL